jgi:2-polyprenyl-3-methyl-5-hydroxy-6-metoxy-1,4-benzoquinol methylase
VKATALALLRRLGLLRPAYRAYEALSVLRAAGRPARPADDGLPVPPPGLIVRVAGTADVGWFLESGRLAAESVQASLARHGRRIEELTALLDFGCGCGRVTRRWASLDGTAVHGADANEHAIAWCRANLPFARFTPNHLAPPLACADASFDLVYGLSVFTHLPEDLQHAWMDELERLLRPGGFLLLTTHGERYRERLAPSERAAFDAGRLVVRWPEGAGTNLCSAFHPPSYVKDRLAAGLEVAEFVPEGAKGNPHQDLYLLKKAQ